MNQETETKAFAAEPAWVRGKNVDERLFCQAFLKQHPMVCVGGRLFTVDGHVHDEAALMRQVYDLLSPWVRTGLRRKAEDLVELLRVETYQKTLPLHTDRIHVANGTLYLDGTFLPVKEYCRNRLPVRYDPDAAFPEAWIRFVSDLLEPEDILTLQEYLGYCLLPTTKAQKMLMLIGRGGEGKSRVGAVMRRIFGQNMVNGSLGKVVTNRFARADLENKLVMVDDDMQMEGLPDTSYLKTIITADQPLDLERKGQQSYQGELYARFLGFGNGSIKALYDRSYGFFRRQIILTTKPRDPDRRDDPELAAKLTQDPEGLLYWCFCGLQRLIGQNWQFTISERSRKNHRAAIAQGDNIREFLSSNGYLRFHPEAEASTRALYAAYRTWCEDNACTPLSQRSFSTYLSENAETWSLRGTNNLYYLGRRIRGYIGVEVE